MIRFGKVFIVLFLSCLACQENRIALEDWQDQVEKNDKRLINILTVETYHFYLSLNKREDSYFALYYKDFKKKSYQDYIGYWVETHYGDKKVILDKGFSVTGNLYGIYFKQSEKFDEIHFCYRLSGKDERRVVFSLTPEGWKCSELRSDNGNS